RTSRADAAQGAHQHQRGVDGPATGWGKMGTAPPPGVHAPSHSDRPRRAGPGGGRSPPAGHRRATEAFLARLPECVRENNPFQHSRLRANSITWNLYIVTCIFISVFPLSAGALRAGTDVAIPYPTYTSRNIGSNVRKRQGTVRWMFARPASAVGAWREAGCP